MFCVKEYTVLLYHSTVWITYDNFVLVKFVLGTFGNITLPNYLFSLEVYSLLYVVYCLTILYSLCNAHYNEFTLITMLYIKQLEDIIPIIQIIHVIRYFFKFCLLTLVICCCSATIWCWYDNKLYSLIFINKCEVNYYCSCTEENHIWVALVQSWFYESS